MGFPNDSTIDPKKNLEGISTNGAKNSRSVGNARQKNVAFRFFWAHGRTTVTRDFSLGKEKAIALQANKNAASRAVQFDFPFFWGIVLRPIRQTIKANHE